MRRFCMAWQKQRRISRRQFTLFLDKHQLRHEDMGRYLDVSTRTIARYVKGTKIPAAVSLLIASLDARGEAPLVPPER